MRDDEVERTPIGVSRRTVLRSGAAAGAALAVAPFLMAARADAAPPGLVQPVDGGDSAPAIQAAIDAAAAHGGGTVMLAAGEFAVGSSLVLKDNVAVRGSGMQQTVVRDLASLGAQSIILVEGSETARVKNTGLACLTIRNGTATTGALTIGKNGITLTYADGFRMDRVLVTEVQGSFGLSTTRTRNVTVTRCRFYRCTYSMFSVLIECDNVTVLDSEFDTVLSTAYPQSYQFHTGAGTLNEGEYFCTNVRVERCAFRNHPYWQSLNSHGCSGLRYAYNTFENCHTAIGIGTVAGYVAKPVIENVVVEGNVAVQGNPPLRIGDYGIVVTGGGTSDLLARNVTIRGNKVTGFAGHDANAGSIIVYTMDGVVIEDNEIDDFGTYGIVLFTTVRNARVRNNRITDMARFWPGRAGTTSAIASLGPGNYGVQICDNSIDATAADKRPDLFLYQASEFGSFQVGPNRIRDVVNADPYFNADFLPVDKDTIPAQYLQQRHGDVATDTSGRQRWVVTAPDRGYGSLDTSTVIVTAATTAGSPVLTIAVAGGDWRRLPPGMNVVIKGAGAGGADLQARVLSADSGELILDRAAETTASGAAVTYGSLSFAPIS